MNQCSNTNRVSDYVGFNTDCVAVSRHTNLYDEGRVTAVVDLESAGRGDRVIDTVGLLYMVEPHPIDVVRDAALAIASPEALAVCGVYWIVRRLYLGIRTDDNNLRPAVEQMLACFDMLS
jgi:hypothetical protein